jgi:hypothetical protein
MNCLPEKRHGLKSALIFSLCSLVAAAGSYALYLDFERSAGEGLGASMAKIERNEYKVRRKPSKSFAWSATHSDEKLYRKDSVQTGAGSGASIRFLDGSLLELGENSLVVIDDVEKLSLEYIKGSVVLHTAEGDKHVAVGEDGKAKFVELPFRVLKPEPLARYYVAAQDEKTVHFSWKARKTQKDAPAGALLVEISSDRKFVASETKTLPVPQQEDSPGATDFDTHLGEGSYYWRLTSDGKPLSEVGQFRIVSAKPLHPVSPSETDALSTFGDEISAQFRWMAPDDAALSSLAKHEIQLSATADFAKVLKSQEISAASGVALVHGLTAGKTWWRIVSRYGDIQVESPALGFEIAKKQSPTLALLLPDAAKTLEKLPTLRFSWKSDAEGMDYGIEIKDSQDKTLVSQHGPNTGYVWNGAPAGAYRWKVAAYLKDKRVAETEWRPFSVFEGARVVLRAPAQNEGIFYWEEPAAFDFKWDADELVARLPESAYQVQIASNPDFKSPIPVQKTRATALSKTKIELPAGQYYWRVAIVDDKGQTLKASDTWKFTYGNYPELGPPTAITPANRAVYDLTESEQTPVASWSEVKDAQAYEVSLYSGDPGRAPASGKPVFKTTTAKATVEFKNLPAGSYYWTVRALDRIQRGGKAMPPRPFTITEGEALEAPEVTSSEVQ